MKTSDIIIYVLYTLAIIALIGIMVVCSGCTIVSGSTAIGPFKATYDAQYHLPAKATFTGDLEYTGPVPTLRSMRLPDPRNPIMPPPHEEPE